MNQGTHNASPAWTKSRTSVCSANPLRTSRSGRSRAAFVPKFHLNQPVLGLTLSFVALHPGHAFDEVKIGQRKAIEAADAVASVVNCGRRPSILLARVRNSRSESRRLNGAPHFRFSRLLQSFRKKIWRRRACGKGAISQPEPCRLPQLHEGRWCRRSAPHCLRAGPAA